MRIRVINEDLNVDNHGQVLKAVNHVHTIQGVFDDTSTWNVRTSYYSCIKFNFAKNIGFFLVVFRRLQNQIRVRNTTQYRTFTKD